MNKMSVALCASVFASGLACAEDVKQGVSGEIGFLTGVTSITSNFNTEQNTKNGALNSEGKADESAALFPLGQLRYQFDRHQLFVGTSEEDIIKGVLAFELGYKNQLSNNSTLSLSYLPTVASGETWADPFVTGAKREKTDVDGNAYRIKYEFLSLVTDFVYYDRDIEDEKSAATQGVDSSLLKRDGDGYLARIGVGLPIANSSYVEPAVYYRKDSADGKAMAYDRLGAGLTYAYFRGDSLFSINTRYSKSNFDASNPLFNQKREDTKLDVNISYEYTGVFGFNNLTLSTIATYGETDSNIQFYDEDNYAFLVGSRFIF